MWNSMDSYVLLVFVLLNGDDIYFNFRGIYRYEKEVNYKFIIRCRKNHYE